jgi:hypothetical protein
VAAPDVEEVTEGVGALDRRLRVNDPVRRVGVKPHEAGCIRDERSGARSLDFFGWRDPDPRRHLAWNAVDEDREMCVDMEQHLLARPASDAVDSLPSLEEAWRRQRAFLRNRHALGSQRSDRADRNELSHGREGRERKGRRAGAPASGQCKNGSRSEGGDPGCDSDTRASARPRPLHGRELQGHSGACASARFAPQEGHV